MSLSLARMRRFTCSATASMTAPSRPTFSSAYTVPDTRALAASEGYATGNRCLYLKSPAAASRLPSSLKYPNQLLATAKA